MSTQRLLRPSSDSVRTAAPWVSYNKPWVNHYADVFGGIFLLPAAVPPRNQFSFPHTFRLCPPGCPALHRTKDIQAITAWNPYCKRHCLRKWGKLHQATFFLYSMSYSSQCYKHCHITTCASISFGIYKSWLPFDLVIDGDWYFL